MTKTLRHQRKYTRHVNEYDFYFSFILRREVEENSIQAKGNIFVFENKNTLE